MRLLTDLWRQATAIYARLWYVTCQHCRLSADRDDAWENGWRRDELGWCCDQCRINERDY